MMDPILHANHWNHAHDPYHTGISYYWNSRDNPEKMQFDCSPPGMVARN